jgi:hypothetical protein
LFAKNPEHQLDTSYRNNEFFSNYKIVSAVGMRFAPHRIRPRYMFLPVDGAGSVEMRCLREDFGIQVIPYNPSPDHKEVVEFVEYLASHVPVPSMPLS